MTAQELIEDALTLAGKLGPGRGANTSDSEVSLRALNSMLSGWATQGLTIPVVRSDEYNLVADQQTYTIGEGGDFDAARPLAINRANLLTSDTPPYRTHLEVITVHNWADVAFPTLESTIPSKLYYAPFFPLGQIVVWPVPTETRTIELFTRQGLARINALNEILEFVPEPPGYEEAVKYNLALRLKGLFPKALAISRDQLAIVQTIARTSLGDIKRINRVKRPLRCEPIFGGRSGWDYRTGE